MQHDNLFLAIGGLVTAAGGYFMWFITNQHVLAIMGFIALCLSIYGGILTIIERRMNIRNKKRGNRH